MTSSFARYAILASAATIATTVYPPQRLRAQGQRATTVQSFMVGPDRLTFLTKILSLTAPQQSQVKAILSDEDSAVKPLMDQMKQTWDELASAATTQDGDIDAVATEMGTISGQIVALDTKAASKVYQLLTPGQKQKFNRLPPPMLATPSLLGPGPALAGAGAVVVGEESGPGE